MQNKIVSLTQDTCTQNAVEFRGISLGCYQILHVLSTRLDFCVFSDGQYVLSGPCSNFDISLEKQNRVNFLNMFLTTRPRLPIGDAVELFVCLNHIADHYNDPGLACYRPGHPSYTYPRPVNLSPFSLPLPITGNGIKGSLKWNKLPADSHVMFKKEKVEPFVQIDLTPFINRCKEDIEYYCQMGTDELKTAVQMLLLKVKKREWSDKAKVSCVAFAEELCLNLMASEEAIEMAMYLLKFDSHSYLCFEDRGYEIDEWGPLSLVRFANKLVDDFEVEEFLPKDLCELTRLLIRRSHLNFGCLELEYCLDKEITPDFSDVYLVHIADSCASVSLADEERREWIAARKTILKEIYGICDSLQHVEGFSAEDASFNAGQAEKLTRYLKIASALVFGDKGSSDDLSNVCQKCIQLSIKFQIFNETMVNLIKAMFGRVGRNNPDRAELLDDVELFFGLRKERILEAPLADTQDPMEEHRAMESDDDPSDEASQIGSGNGGGGDPFGSNFGDSGEDEQRDSVSSCDPVDSSSDENMSCADSYGSLKLVGDIEPDDDLADANAVANNPEGPTEANAAANAVDAAANAAEEDIAPGDNGESKLSDSGVAHSGVERVHSNESKLSKAGGIPLDVARAHSNESKLGSPGIIEGKSPRRNRNRHWQGK